MSLAGMIRDVLKSTQEFNQGKIQVYPNGYEFGTIGCTNQQGVFLGPSEDENSASIQLTLGIRTAFNCPSPPNNVFPKLKSGYSVPMKVCRKCPNHEPRRRNKNFPSCKELVKLRANSPKPAEVLGQVFGLANKNMSEFMGKL